MLAFNLPPLRPRIGAQELASARSSAPADSGDDSADAPSFSATLQAIQRSNASGETSSGTPPQKVAKSDSKQTDKTDADAADQQTNQAPPQGSSDAPASSHDPADADASGSQSSNADAPKKNDKAPALDAAQAAIVASNSVIVAAQNSPPASNAPAGTADAAASPAKASLVSLAGLAGLAHMKLQARADATADADATATKSSATGEGDDAKNAAAANSAADASAADQILTTAKDVKSQQKSPFAAHIGAPSDANSLAAPGAADALASGAAATANVNASATPDLASLAPAIASKNNDAPAPDAFLAMPQAAFAPTHGDLGKAEVAPAAQDSPTRDVPDTFDQVMLGLKGKFDARSGKADIRLDPPNLGTVHVSVSLVNGQLTAEFQSASNVVRDLLRGNLDKLKSSLQTQGVAVDRLAVDAPPSAGTSAGQQFSGSFGSATHDGRSAGQYQQNGQSGQGSGGAGTGDGFAQMFTQAQDAPLDLVA